MKNPCSECIVTSACKVACETYIKYIFEAFYSYGFLHSNHRNIAHYARAEVELYFCNGMTTAAKDLNDKSRTCSVMVIVEFDRNGTITNISRVKG